MHAKEGSGTGADSISITIMHEISNFYLFS